MKKYSKTNFNLPLLSRNCNVKSSLINGNFPLNQFIFGCGRPLYEQFKLTSVPAFLSIRTIDGKSFLNSNLTGS